MHRELTQPTLLLDQAGNLNQVGWARYPILECNLENVNIYPRWYRQLQFMRIKRWDYYAIFTPNRFFSATIADLGYAGNVFVYTMDLETGELHEEGLVIPFGRGISLSRDTVGVCRYRGQGVSIYFHTHPGLRSLAVDWPEFHDGRGIHTEISLSQVQGHESMNIVIPIPKKRFYYNHKINCLPASGHLTYGDVQEELSPENCLGQLDWGRGVWEYSSFWNWASASGFLPDRRTIGLNLGTGFGDTSVSTEDALILEGVIHKLDRVHWDYAPGDYMQPWKFKDEGGRLDLVFTPFKDRTATTRLGIIDSEVHQMFGRYSGFVVADDGEEIKVESLIGFAEEHKARW